MVPLRRRKPALILILGHRRYRFAMIKRPDFPLPHVLDAILIFHRYVRFMPERHPKVVGFTQYRPRSPLQAYQSAYR